MGFILSAIITIAISAVASFLLGLVGTIIITIALKLLED